jgi:phosphopantothenoylcysteine decarboxylase/phosphopantothenate--cysteine ligase
LATPTLIERVEVESAIEMADATWRMAAGADCVILAAAVADFRPVSVADIKIRRADGAPEINLTETPNVLAGVVSLEPKPFVVGFAAQTGSLDDAKRKAVSYGTDLLVANDVSAPQQGFGTDTNEVTLMWPDGTTEDWDFAPKSEIADRLMALVAGRLPAIGRGGVVAN